jgi:regulator of CtrA degradation
MNGVANINPRVVEALYIEALVLADAARAGFEELRAGAAGAWGIEQGATAEPVHHLAKCPAETPDDVELACEALRTTTRVMHCLAWLLNHRAWFAGQISTVQLRRHGRLISHFPGSDPAIVHRLPGDLADLVAQSERLYARIQRLETAWRDSGAAASGAIERLRNRLAQATSRSA